MNPMKLPLFILSWCLALTAIGQSSTIGTAPNLASLSNRPPSAINPVVITQGRVTPGDGKGGMYTWVPGNSSAIDWTNVVGSSLTSSGRWLLSLPSPTPLTSDGSKVDRTNGAAVGLALTGSSTIGGAAIIGGSGTAGQFPAFNGTSSLGASGVSTNAARNVERVVLTSAELVATSPQDLMSTTGGTLAYVTTTGDTVAGSGARHWMWSAASTAATNFANAGGPIAYPYGSASGRWIEVEPYTAVDARIMTMTALYPDADDGTTNPNNPTSYINSLYSAAEAAYSPTLGRVTVRHANGVFTVDELILCGKVVYESPPGGVCHFKKRSQPVGTVNRSIASTRRLGFMNLDATDGSFLSWGAAGGTNDYYQNPDNWYGQSDDMSFTGSGKIIFDQNQKDCTLPMLRLAEVRRFWVDPGVIEVWHNDATNAVAGTTTNNWAVSLGGREIVWYYPIVRNGTRTYQDGFHIGWGRDIFIFGGYGETGDDSIVCQAEAAGAFTNPPDEPLERVYIQGWRAKSNKGRAVNLHAGINWVQVPYVNRTPELKDIVVDGVVGSAGVARQSGMQIGNFQDGTGIWHYTIDNPGSGYTDGYYTIAVGNTGGGSGAQCSVKVVGGQIVRAYMAKVSGSFRYGTGYRQDQLATVASIPGGSGAVVTGVVFGSPNNRVVRCSVRNFAIDVGSTTHDGIEPYALRIHGATDCNVGPGTFNITDNVDDPTYPANSFRPYVIQSASNCVVKDVLFTPTYRGGSIAANDLPKSYVTRITFDGVTLGPHQHTGHGLCKVNGDTVGRIDWMNSTFKVNTGTAAIYLPDLESSKVCHSDYLNVQNCLFIADSGASNTRAIDFVPGGGTGNMLGQLRFTGNTLVNITGADTAAVVQAAATAYEVDGNTGGYRTKLGNVVTQTSGTSQVSVTVSTYTGLIDNTTASLPCVRVVPLGNPGSNWWVEPSTTGAFLIKTASAVGADLNWAVYVDTSRKPLTGY